LYDFLLILILALLGILAHVARKRRWLEWILRFVIFTVAILEGLLLIAPLELFISPWAINALSAAVLSTLLLLFMPIRRLFSWLFTGLDLLITGQILVPLIKKQVKAAEYFLQSKIFTPSSFPHLMALFIYVTTAAYLLMSIDPDSFKMPYMPLPIPLMLLQLLSYNGIGLILLAFCGVGVFVTRSYKEAFTRLGLVKPTNKQIGLGILLIAASFLYDWLWSQYTHNLGGQDLATKLSYYNSGTFTAAGGAVPSAILALATALCAGIGEETLTRGALQPVFGIVPAALLHGMLHGQFAHAPIFIVQVFIWSIMMGLVRRYTNTTTTIIGHAGFNLITTFLFAFNP